MAGESHELRTGCRRGDQAALDALLYGCADGIYAMALTVVPDEQAAQECVREAWRRMLSALQRWRFDGSPQRCARRIMLQVLAERVGAQAARSAEAAALRDDGSLGLDGVRLPEAVLQDLSSLSARQRPAIRASRLGRRHLFRAALAALVVTTALVWVAVLVQHARQSQGLAQLKFECLRRRVIKQGLPSAMREAAARLEDPTGADRVLAANCERVTLVLEEVANSESLAQLSGLRFARRRIAEHQLADFVRELADQEDGLSAAMQRVALALEEVQNL
jgi:hypothetical protein